MKSWKPVILLFAVSLLALAVRAASGAPPVSLLVVSDWAYPEIPEGSDGEWLGIFPTARGSEIRKTRVRIQVNEELGEAKVLVDSRDTPVFLVRGLKGAGPGPLPTAEVEGPDDLQSGQRVALRLRGMESSLSVVESPGEEKTWAVVLQSGIGRQILVDPYDWSGGHLRVLWAGDLDGDGRLDLVIDHSPHYASSVPTLFLSSRARPGELVGEAAVFAQYCC